VIEAVLSEIKQPIRNTYKKRETFHKVSRFL